jgi:dephospho-CoA kinase
MMQEAERSTSQPNVNCNGDAGKVYIGLTGLPGAGKGTVIAMLSTYASHHDVAVFRYSLSDEIRDVLRTRDSVASRVCQSDLDDEDGSNRADKSIRLQLIELGNELREKHGSGVLAQRIVSKTGRELGRANCVQTLVIIDAIRHPGEVEEFRKQWGGRFRLIAVEASPESRIRRVVRRGREGEYTGLPQQVEQADREIGIESCIRMADWHILNDGSLTELRESVQALAKQCVFPSLGVGDISHARTPRL